MQKPDDPSDDLHSLSATAPTYATQFVERLLDAARRVKASDVHLQPTPAGLDVRWRLDGVLQPVGIFSRGASSDVVSRLKVLAELLTYRADVPQEGRIRGSAGDVDIRVSSFPTLHGERAVVRLFAAGGSFQRIDDLGLPDAIADALRRSLAQTSGAILVCGPAGSGKTTTAYALLRELVARTGGGRSIVALEDPIEVAVEGVVQSQVHPAAGFDLANGLKSLMRQDPEVILVGEIRDRETAEATFQAALTGHLVVTTFHAGSAAGAISRLADMGIEPYLLRSGLLGILSQRLVRRLCDCKRRDETGEAQLGLHVERSWSAGGCERCFQSGYCGRLVLAEWLQVEHSPLGRAILSRDDIATLQQLAVSAGMTTVLQRACHAIAAGQTSPAEVRRVLGFADA